MFPVCFIAPCVSMREVPTMRTPLPICRPVGDIVVVARGSTVIASDVDTLVSGLRGQHGSLTDAEMDIPLLCAAGHGRG